MRKSKRKSPHPLKSTCKWYKCSNSEAQEIEKTSLRRPLSPLFSFKFCPTMLCLGSCTLLFSGALFFFFLYFFRLQLKPVFLLDWDARYNVGWLGLIKFEGRKVVCITWNLRDHRKPIYKADENYCLVLYMYLSKAHFYNRSSLSLSLFLSAYSFFHIFRVWLLFFDVLTRWFFWMLRQYLELDTGFYSWWTCCI